uniref:Uncharacterized protein n=1 Tax=Glossina austeni TaxID=7395 RepID=A0A1A9VH69_GLOAU
MLTAEGSARDVMKRRGKCLERFSHKQLLLTQIIGFLDIFVDNKFYYTDNVTGDEKSIHENEARNPHLSLLSFRSSTFEEFPHAEALKSIKEPEHEGKKFSK